MISFQQVFIILLLFPGHKTVSGRIPVCLIPTGIAVNLQSVGPHVGKMGIIIISGTYIKKSWVKDEKNRVL